MSDLSARETAAKIDREAVNGEALRFMIENAIIRAKAAERERIEQVIRNCCMAITAETLVRAIRRGGGE